MASVVKMYAPVVFNLNGLPFQVLEKTSSLDDIASKLDSLALEYVTRDWLETKWNASQPICLTIGGAVRTVELYPYTIVL